MIFHQGDLTSCLILGSIAPGHPVTWEGIESKPVTLLVQLARCLNLPDKLTGAVAWDASVIAQHILTFILKIHFTEVNEWWGYE
ncbi:hypothetical protein DPEC_G00015910 [Dallia pectoralis]|uniref:Uncharacterized protein n=1 Tax=Dallia pectoralis TaxID=75939 RepID=A0ACC2HMQ1_DALPE|nr:hypothetical protein DPEC_G00015910 [Dallia pectoralis]